MKKEPTQLTAKKEASIKAHERAYTDSLEKELCRDISQKYTKKKDRTNRDGTRFHYERIALELRAMFPGEWSSEKAVELESAHESLMQHGANIGAKQLTEYFEKELEITARAGEQVSLYRLLKPQFSDAKPRRAFFKIMEEQLRIWNYRKASGERMTADWSIAGVEPFSAALMEHLSIEWLRNPKALRGFLTDCFERWQKFEAQNISEATHPLLRNSLIHQIASNCLNPDGTCDIEKLYKFLMEIGVEQKVDKYKQPVVFQAGIDRTRKLYSRSLSKILSKFSQEPTMQDRADEASRDLR